VFRWKSPDYAVVVLLKNFTNREEAFPLYSLSHAILAICTALNRGGNSSHNMAHRAQSFPAASPRIN
jgi:hypothetical protein